MQKIFVWMILVLSFAAVVFAPFAEMNRPKTDSIDRLVFFPSKYPNGDWSPKKLRFQDIYFSSADNTRLHGWYCPAENPVATILFAHGNAGNVASRAALLRYLQSEIGASVFIFDYRGYGRSAGVPSVNGALQDARAARTKLRSLANVEDSEMLLMGTSVGGAIATQLAAESSPRALILQSTFSSLRDVADVHYPEHSRMVSPTILDAATQIAKFRGSLLLSHGEHDRIVPITSARKLFRAANEPKEMVTIRNADHSSWLTHQYLQRLDQFIRENKDARK